MQEEEVGAEPPEEDGPSASAAGGFGARLRQRVARNVPTSTGAKGAPRAAAAPKQIVDGIDKTERALGIAAIVLALFWAIAGYFVDKHSTVKSVHQGADFGLISNLIFAVIIALGVALRRRALLGFGALFFGLEQTFSYHDAIVGLPFLALGGWLIMRASRKQREIREANGGRGAARTSPPRASRSASAGRPATPKASKRYTPPRRSAASGRR